MTFPLLRPAKLSDLQSFIKFSEIAAYGITSLPRSPDLLEKKLIHTERSFTEKLISPTHETYLFCLEWEKEVIGTTGVTSRIGMTEPFYAYHLLYEPHQCSHLKIDTKTPVLHFMRARKKPTEIGSLFLEKQFRKKEFGKFLSLSRFLFMASFKNRFASTVIAELRGINQEGNSPFWSAVGQHFFHMDFPEADLLRCTHPECLEELFPKHPIYVEMLPKEAQQVIGLSHQNTTPAKKMLEKLGFKLSHYFDLLDAGPHMFARTDEIDAVKNSQTGVIRELRSTLGHGQLAILSNTRLDFRATLAPIIIEQENRVSIPLKTGSLLEVDIGDPIRYYII